MEFIILRTSTWDKEAPCEGVRRKTIDQVEVRTLPDAEEFDKKFGPREGSWMSKGVAHGVTDRGYIKRTLPNKLKVWVMDFEDLGELMEFVSTHGDVVVSKCPDHGTASLEIYDNYRE